MYLKSFGLHVSFKSEKQFEDCYRKKLSEMGCTDLRPVIHEVSSSFQISRKNMTRFSNRLKRNWKEGEGYPMTQLSELSISKPIINLSTQIFLNLR